jgi:hypothetical protein
MHERVYVLGSGFSRALSSTMPIMKDLSAAVRDDLVTLDTPEIPGHDTPVANDFEQWLSYLVEAPPWLSDADRARNQAAFFDVSRAVARVLMRKQSDAVAAPPPKWLQPLLTNWHNTDATVITFNYDLLVELAWKRFVAGVIAFDSWNSPLSLYPAPITPIGARGGNALAELRAPAGLRLLKLHGSLNWWYSGPRATPGDTIWGASLKGEEWSAQGLEWIPEQTEQLAVDLQPMIVPPTAVKSTYYTNQTLQSLWQSAANAIREAKELVVVGFSFPPTDLLVSSLLSTNLPSTSRITPINPTDEVVSRIRKVFGEDEKDTSVNVNDQFAGKHADPVGAWVEALDK